MPVFRLVRGNTLVLNCFNVLSRYIVLGVPRCQMLEIKVSLNHFFVCRRS
jgi:hypothetical protein